MKKKCKERGFEFDKHKKEKKPQVNGAGAKGEPAQKHPNILLPSTYITVIARYSITASLTNGYVNILLVSSAYICPLKNIMLKFGQIYYSTETKVAK